MSNQTVYLAQYTPPAFNIETVDLAIDLYEDHALVENTMQIARVGAGPLCLAGDTLILERISLNSETLAENQYQLDSHQLVLDDVPEQFELVITTRIFPEKNTALSGLYRSNGYFCTQCEAEGFRRITYYLDRPDVLACYSTRISADKKRYPVLLSNGNLEATGELEAGRHWALWRDPFKKPSYLFALVAGDLGLVQDTFVTMSGRTIDLRLYVDPGQEDKAPHALASLKNAMAWDEREYGREYDLDIYMIVAVSSFNMGAMENKGLNLFNSKYVLARPDTATDADYADIEGVVGHEYFHNWTGNRVTCRDWFQLSLKEGLTVFRDQEFSRDMNSRDVNRIQDVKLLRQIQFPEDAGAMAHPVRPSAYQEINNFYTATVYNKGAEVIRMLQTLLGKDGFRQGMDLYFERHDGEAVTIEDFVKAMADANQRDLSGFFKWYTQAGTPIVRLTESAYEKDTLTLSFTQSGVDAPCPIPIDMALFTADGKAIDLNDPVLLLDKATQTFCIKGLKEAPAHISLLRGFSAPIILEREMSDDALLGLLRVETDGFAKWDATQRMARRVILTSYENNAACKLSDAFINTLQSVLEDEALDRALRALLLTPPGFEAVVAGLSEIDVERIEKARDAYYAALGEALWPALLATYTALWREEDHAMHAKAYKRRSLRNACLTLMMQARPKAAEPYCDTQFKTAKTMTDQVAAFGLLVSGPNETLRENAIQAFSEQWQADDLVLDKWFALQASAEPKGALSRVKALLQHPAFDIKNPNKVRAVIGAFSQQNPRHFHAKDGSGYAFLADQVLALDKLNPQIAARLVTPFTRAARLDAPRKAAVQAQLERLSREQLSPDVREMVDKSLS